MIDFTGERFIPAESGEIRYEHMHRYAWAAGLCGGKDVLDIASGEAARVETGSAFAAQRLGASWTNAFRICNSGDAVLTISAYVTNGPAAAMFS